MPESAGEAATSTPPTLRTRLLALLRRCGFDYECFRILGIRLGTTPTTTAAALPEGSRFRELAPADIERSDDASIRSCAWYGGEGATGYAIEGRDGRLLCLQWYWFGERYERSAFWPVQPGGAVSVHLLTVEAERGGGLATALKQLSAVEMRKRGFSALYSRIWWSNHASLGVSRKAGWTRIGTTLRIKLPLVGWTPTLQWK